MEIKEPHFVGTSIDACMDVGEGGFGLRFKNFAGETMLLICPLELIREFIVHLSTTAYQSEIHQGAKGSAGAIPIESVSIDAAPATDDISIVLKLQGGAQIPLAAPPEFARTIAASLLEEVQRLPARGLQ